MGPYMPCSILKCHARNPQTSIKILGSPWKILCKGKCDEWQRYTEKSCAKTSAGVPESARATPWRTLCGVLVALADSLRSADVLELRFTYNDAPRQDTEQLEILLERSYRGYSLTFELFDLRFERYFYVTKSRQGFTITTDLDGKPLDLVESELASIGARAVMENLTSERGWALRTFRSTYDHENNRPSASYEASFRWASYEDDRGKLPGRVPWLPSGRA